MENDANVRQKYTYRNPVSEQKHITWKHAVETSVYAKPQTPGS